MNTDAGAGAGARVLGRIFDRARETPTTIALRFVQDASGTAQVLTWQELALDAWNARECLRQCELNPGDRIVLMLPTGRPYVSALFGALWAGLVPTTLPPTVGGTPASARDLDEIIAIFAPRAIIGSPPRGSQSVLLLAADDLERESATMPADPDFSALHAIAYVQFTSGSTGRPRGLALSWRAIEANISAIECATGMGAGQRSMSWLPMYHDMGIFGGLLSVLHAGCEHTLTDPSVFTANPLTWLRLLDQYRSTMTVAPPSALKACIDLLERRPSMQLDLSALDQIICGAEPVPPNLQQRLMRALGPYGLRDNVLRPSYGLAEATVAVSFTPPARQPRVDVIAREQFEDTGTAIPASEPSDGTLEWVSAGSPLPGIQVRIVGEDGADLSERHVGSICVKSPSLYTALLENGAYRSREGEWLDTGDLGYVADGEVYVTGRAKDLIIKNGRNYSPERLEHAVSLTTGVRRCAAFGVIDPDKSTERLVLMVEGQSAHMNTAEGRDRLRLTVRAELRAYGFPVDEVFLMPKGTLPLTTSGKVRRQECRRLYLQQRYAGRISQDGCSEAL